MKTLQEIVTDLTKAGRILNFGTIERVLSSGEKRFSFYFDNGTESRSVLRVSAYLTPTGKPKKNRSLSIELTTMTQYDKKRRSFMSKGSTFSFTDTYDAEEIKTCFKTLEDLKAKLPGRDGRYDSAIITHLYLE